MKKQVILLIIMLELLYAEQYPTLYSPMGTPLYEARFEFEKLTYLDNIQKKSIDYEKSVQFIVARGIELESYQIIDKKMRKDFLYSLRTLQKEYQLIIYLLNNYLLESIKRNDVELFFNIVNSNLEGIARESTLFTKTIDFYKNNNINSPYLDMLIKEDSIRQQSQTRELHKIEREKTALHVIGVYEGDYPNGVRHTFGFHPEGKIDIEITNNPEVKSYILVLTSCEPINWYISNKDRAKIKKIILSSHHPSKVHGVSGVPIIRSSLGCSYKELSSELLNKIENISKFDTQSFQGSYKGKLFEIY